MIGSIKLMDFYKFLMNYHNETNDLDLLYEKNVRRYLGTQRKINKKIKETLEKEPEHFGLYNNGITLVVDDFQKLAQGNIELTQPYIVNGCQTTGTIWNVLDRKFNSGGTGSNPKLAQWKNKVNKSIVVIKIVKVSSEEQSNNITRYTNSQNRVDEKDLAILGSDFQKWQRQMQHKYGIYLEIKRVSWDAKKAYQKKYPNSYQFEEYAKLLDLIKVYGAGWLGVPGTALGKNPPFLPNGNVFQKINNDSFDGDSLYAAYLLQKISEEKPYGPFGRKAAKEKKESRGSTRFFFYYIVIELFKAVLIEAKIELTPINITKSFLKLFRARQQSELLNAAMQLLDEYFQNKYIVNEPNFSALNVYLKSDQLGKEEFSPKLHQLINDFNRTLKRPSIHGGPTPIEMILKTVT